MTYTMHYEITSEKRTFLSGIDIFVEFYDENRSRNAIFHFVSSFYSFQFKLTLSRIVDCAHTVRYLFIYLHDIGTVDNMLVTALLLFFFCFFPYMQNNHASVILHIDLRVEY